MSLSGVVLLSYPSDSDSLQDSIKTRIAQLTFWVTGFTESHLNADVIFSGVSCIHRWPASMFPKKRQRNVKCNSKKKNLSFLFSEFLFLWPLPSKSLVLFPYKSSWPCEQISRNNNKHCLYEMPMEMTWIDHSSNHSPEYTYAFLTICFKSLHLSDVALCLHATPERLRLSV